MGLSSLLNLDDSDDEMNDKKKEQILQQIEEQEKAHDSYASTSNSSHVIKKGRFGDFSSW